MLRDLIPRGRDAVPMALAWIAGLVALVFLMQRYRYGVELTDETFSIAMPYRFARGDKPFVDEISIQQTAGLVLFPFVWIWVKIVGSTGIVLYVRAIHFIVFKGAAAVATWLAGRQLLSSKAGALALAFTPFVFVPHSVANVGYNAIGMSLLMAGSFCLVAAISEKSDKRALRTAFAGGIAMSLMTFAYPPMGVAAVLSAPLLFACAPRRRFALTGAFVAGGLAGLVLVSPSFLFGGVAGVKRSLGWGAHAGGAHGWARVHAMLQVYWLQMPPVIGWLGGLLVVAGVTRSRVLATVGVLAGMLTIVLWYPEDPGYPGTARTVIYLGSLAPAFLFAAWPDRQLVRSALLVIVPSFATATVAAVYSTQGLDAAALGLYACVVLIALLGFRAIERSRVGVGLALLPIFIVLYVYVNRSWTYIYRESPIASLTETVKVGPFKGLKTTADRAAMMSEMNDIVRQFDKPDGHILILYEQPGLYLASKMPPSAHSVWEATYGDLEGMRAFFETKANGNGIVVRVKGTGSSSIDSILTPPERKVLETRHFIVYRDK